MRIHLLLFLLISHAFHTIAQQQYNYKSMVVSKADMLGTTYQKDSTANAFFIYEKGFSRVENGGNYNLYLYVREWKIIKNRTQEN